jgi:hypothetical protein
VPAAAAATHQKNDIMCLMPVDALRDVKLSSVQERPLGGSSAAVGGRRAAGSGGGAKCRAAAPSRCTQLLPE